MWLLDHNVPRQLLNVLQSVSIPCDTTYNRGWNRLENGELVKRAAASGFSCILTRDKLFSQAARKVLKSNLNLAIVLLSIPQSTSKQYVTTFLKEWEKQSINPIPGQVVIWPSQ